MIVKLRILLWEMKQHRVVIGVVGTVLVVVIALIIVGYGFDWTGFNGYNKVTIVHTLSGTNAGTVTRTEEYQQGKTLWDWLQLLFVPVVIAIGGFWLNLLQKSREERATQRLEVDNQREASLQAYLANISELLLDKDNPLRESKPEDEVQKIARVRTLTVLPRLDGIRKGSVLQFLYESVLIDRDNRIIELFDADLRRAYLSGNLLSRADLSGADLRDAFLTGADLSGANLNKANLSGADLSGANLRDAYGLTQQQLDHVRLCKNAILPPGLTCHFNQ